MTSRLAFTVALSASVSAAACVAKSGDDDGAAGAAGTTSSGASAGSSGSGAAASGGSVGAGSGGASNGAGAGGSVVGGTSGAAGSTGVGGGGAGGGSAGAGGATAGAGGTTAGGGGTAAGGGGAAAGAAGTTAGGGGTAAGSGGGTAGFGGATNTSKYTWKRMESPCDGDFVLGTVFESPTRWLVGCGSFASNKGIVVTNDGGKTWTKQPKFADVTVGRLRKASDGTVFVAGSNSLDASHLMKVNTDAPNNLAPEALFTGSISGDTALNIGDNPSRTNDGKILVDSLSSGAAALMLPGKEFVEYRTLHEDAIANPATTSLFRPQVVLPFGNDFYGAGGREFGGAVVYLPTKLVSPAYHFAEVPLQLSSEEGAFYDLHVWSPTSMIVAGYDTTYKLPLLFVCDGDPYVKASWKPVDLLGAGLSFTGGFDALAVLGDKVVVVGQNVTGPNGAVLESNDRGKTWKDIAPTLSAQPVPSMQAAAIAPDGQVVLADTAEMFIFGP